MKSAMNFPVDEELKLAALTKTQKKSLESGMLKESEKEAGSQSVEPNGVENLGTDKIETSILPVNYETVYQGFQNISPDLKSAEYEVERARYDYKIAKADCCHHSLSVAAFLPTIIRISLRKGNTMGLPRSFATTRANTSR